MFFQGTESKIAKLTQKCIWVFDSSVISVLNYYDESAFYIIMKITLYFSAQICASVHSGRVWMPKRGTSSQTDSL